MLDVRLLALRFCRRNSVTLTSIGSISVIILTIFGMILELHKSCQPDLKAWLCIVSVTLFIRLAVKYLVLLVQWRYLEYHGDIHQVLKILSIVDAFLFIWFCVGVSLICKGFYSKHINIACALCRTCFYLVVALFATSILQ